MATASLISRLSQAVDQIEQRMQQKRPWKVVKVRCGYHEDRDVAQDRHYAPIPRTGTRISCSSTFAMMRK